MNYFIVLNGSTEHKGHHHHDHVHDSAVSSVSIVAEGTLDLDEVIVIFCFLDLYGIFFFLALFKIIFILNHLIAFCRFDTLCFNFQIIGGFVDGFVTLLVSIFLCYFSPNQPYFHLFIGTLISGPQSVKMIK